MQQDIIDRVINGLDERGALAPFPTGRIEGVIGIFLYNPAQLRPAAAPMVRFHRARDTLKRHGQAEHTQLFYNWQRAFFAQGLHIYFPTKEFLEWCRSSLSVLVQSPLPDFYKGIVCDHIEKFTASDNSVDSFPIMQDMAPGPVPGPSMRKETMGDLAIAQSVIAKNPHLLLASALFHASHIDYLNNIGRRLKERPDIAPEARAVYGDALSSLAINIANANFVRIPIWIAIAHHNRLQASRQDVGQISLEDFVAGWRLLEKGHGFTTKITPRTGGARPPKPLAVVCPYQGLGRSLAAQELCSGPAKKPEQHTNAYGLWCIYNLLVRTSSPFHGPFQDDLSAIADTARTGSAVNHPYLSETGRRDRKIEFKRQFAFGD